MLLQKPKNQERFYIFKLDLGNILDHFINSVIPFFLILMLLLEVEQCVRKYEF